MERIAAALERLAPPAPEAPDFSAPALVWRDGGLHEARAIAHVDLDLLVGLDRNTETLLANTRQFARGHMANNALLWGARGMGKSSLVKAVFMASREEGPLRLVEIPREDLPQIGRLLSMLAGRAERFLLFCDDLSFDKDDSHYKSLKAILDGGIEGRPDNVLLYATSNRRHLMPRDMIENERQSGIHPSEAVEEKLSLSDRFGLWLGFYPADQDTYLKIIRGYVDRLGISITDEALRAEAIEWSQTRGARSGRVAWQYICDLAGRNGIAPGTLNAMDKS
ncbi:ATP-binding protein [Paracoccaceae bacterium GXU_MW_L88]